jgi:hypothetical protein
LLLLPLLALLQERRNRKVLQIALVPVFHHQLRSLLHLGHPSLAQLAMSSAYLGQKVYLRVERLNFIVLLQLVLGNLH